MLSHIVNHFNLSCGSICGAAEQVHKLFAVQCGMRMELSSAVQFVNKNFVDCTISIPHQFGVRLYDVARRRNPMHQANFELSGVGCGNWEILGYY